MNASKADFTYEITPNTLTITDSHPRQALRDQRILMLSCARLSTGTEARSPRSKPCIAMNVGFGTVFGGTANVLPSELCETDEKKAIAKLVRKKCRMKAKSG